jgi:hypothetical protein
MVLRDGLLHLAQHALNLIPGDLAGDLHPQREHVCMVVASLRHMGLGDGGQGGEDKHTRSFLPRKTLQGGITATEPWPKACKGCRGAQHAKEAS